MDNLSVNQNDSLCAEYNEWYTILRAAATSTLMAFQSLRQNVPSTQERKTLLWITIEGFVCHGEGLMVK